MTDKFNRPINGYGSRAETSGVTKAYIRSNYIESEIEENIDLKNYFRIKNVPNPENEFDSVSRKYVDLRSESIARYVDEKSASVERYVDEKSMSIQKECLDAQSAMERSIDEISSTASRYVDENFVSISNLENNTIVRNNQENNMNNNSIKNIEQIELNKAPINANHAVRFSDLLNIFGVDAQEEVLLKESTLVRNNQENNMNNNSLINLNKITVTEPAIEDNDVPNIKQVNTLINNMSYLLTERLQFTNKTGNDLWRNWKLEVNELSEIDGVFKSRKCIEEPDFAQHKVLHDTQSVSQSEFDALRRCPKIGTHYAVIVPMTQDSTSTGTRHLTKVTRIRFFYNSKVDEIATCKFSFQYQDKMSNLWVEWYTITGVSDWVFLDFDLSSQKPDAIRFEFTFISLIYQPAGPKAKSNSKSFMALSDLELQFQPN